MKSILISFEGIDGSGKSTQAGILFDLLKSMCIPVNLFREPGGTHIGENIRKILLDKNNSDISPLTELFLYLSARAQITHSLILPALLNGEIVIMDRYIDSTTAYQGFARGLGFENAVYLNKIVTEGLVPDITFFIDCPPETALKRIKTDFDRLESEGLSFMKKVREGFLKIAEIDKERVVVCNGESDIVTLKNHIIGVLSSRFHIFQNLSSS